MFDDISIARAIHVLGVVLWIGGVGFVTTVLLPAIRRMDNENDPVALFEKLERQFSLQARITTILVGLSGFYMVFAWDLWERFAQIEFYWMHAMVLIWTVFSVVLFVAEPLFLHRWFRIQAKQKPTETFRLIQLMHWVLLAASLVTVLAAVLGSH